MYASYAKQFGLTHAQCWSHSRRELFEAEAADPEGVREGLRRIAAIYAVEEEIREKNLSGEIKRLHRLTHSKPHVEAIFQWVNQRLEQHRLAPATPFTKALKYIRDRRLELQVFLDDPDVPVDTNHLERALRVIPMGRNYARSTPRNWASCRA